MSLYCHNCEQQSIFTNNNLSCPYCKSEAIEITNNNPQNYSRETFIQGARDEWEERPSYDPFQSMNRMMRHESMFRGMFDRERENFSIHPLMERMISRNMGMEFGRMNERRPEHSYEFNQQIILGPQGILLFSSNQNPQEEWESLPTEAKPELKNFPCIESLSQECSICQSKENKGIILPCGHQFHNECISPWFDMKNTCPCCRVQL